MTRREPLPRSEAEAAEDRYWELLYGRWESLDPAGVQRFLMAFDLPLTPDRDGLWSNKRLPGHVAPVEAVTWVAPDGIRYLAPEIVLLYKARLGRVEDTRDLDLTWPLLDAGARTWLREAIARLHPGHAWLERMV